MVHGFTALGPGDLTALPAHPERVSRGEHAACQRPCRPPLPTRPPARALQAKASGMRSVSVRQLPQAALLLGASAVAEAQMRDVAGM